jgi:hypothetical protein
MVPMLQVEGFEVMGFDSDLFDGCVFGGPSFDSVFANIPFFRKDIRDVELSDLRGNDAVIHATLRESLSFNSRATAKKYDAKVPNARIAQLYHSISMKNTS